MPCPHHDIKIIQRSNHQSAVASAAYQSGERLFSEYDQKQKYYSHKSEIVHTEIMLPPHAPPAVSYTHLDVYKRQLQDGEALLQSQAQCREPRGEAGHFPRPP